MIDLANLQIIAQLIDNIDIVSKELESGYNNNNGEKFNKAKKEVLDLQSKISRLVDSK